ncbi:MAG: helix-turn-helix transcriptional regulator [Myxococcota bacterium]
MTRDEERVRLCRARILLESTEFPEPGLAEIARRIGMSESHFSRRFKAWFAETPHQYRIRTKLQRARSMLTVERHSVTDVCFALGYSSLGSFSASFHRRSGESPDAFRRRWASPAAAQENLQPDCLRLMPSSFEEAQARPSDILTPDKEVRSPCDPSSTA